MAEAFRRSIFAQATVAAFALMLGGATCLADDAKGPDQGDVLTIKKGANSIYKGNTDIDGEGQDIYVDHNFLLITARVESVTITNITVNRGNCTVNAPDLPSTLKFGEQYRVFVDCDALEASIRTDKSDIRFEWKE